MNTNTTTETNRLRTEAEAHDAEAAASFERCDTDGYLSQWAHGINANRKRAEADLLEAGGVWLFPVLTDLDGNVIRSKRISTQYGPSFGIIPDGKFFGGYVSKWVGWPKREATLTKKGYRIGWGYARAEVRMSDGLTPQPYFNQLDFVTEIVACELWSK